jgi:UDP-N-acetylmuramoylalanine--D-glutamate ligase
VSPRVAGRFADGPLSLGSDWSGARVTVMGLGLFGGGAAVARALARRGARVTVTDRRGERELAPALAEIADLGLELALGGHRARDFTRADLVVANPAVPPGAPELAAARAAGVPVSSEAALFLASCPSRLVLVTGTQGKSSVCNALAQLFGACGTTAHLGGNVGRPLLDRVEELAPEDVVVLELSSYQLEALPPAASWRGRAPRVEAVCVTNVLADHLERHGSVAAYREAKRRVLELLPGSGGVAVLPAGDPELATPAWRPAGARRVEVHAAPCGRGLDVAGGVFRLDGEALGHARDVRLPGAFQRANVLLALGLARLAGADPGRLARAVAGVVGLPHRLEDLGCFAGHRVWDNGVSTTPDSTEGVLESLRPGFALL